jgi:hypothetical protein
MSKQLWEESDELPSGTLFYGGIDRGMCTQLTHLERGVMNFSTGKREDVHQYITFSIKSIKQLIKKLKEAEKEAKK